MSDQIARHRPGPSEAPPASTARSRGRCCGTVRTSQTAAAGDSASPDDLPAPVAHDGQILPPQEGRRSGSCFRSLFLRCRRRWRVRGLSLVRRRSLPGVSTDDAYVKADTSTMAAKVGGYVASGAGRSRTSSVSPRVMCSSTIDDGDYRNAVDTAKHADRTPRSATHRSHGPSGRRRKAR